MAASEKAIQNALDMSWERINALGGYAAADDKRANGVNWTVERALEIIESLGGCNPQRRRELERPTCDCAAETTGKWADKHSPHCAIFGDETH